jgi:gliding motility-associated-like protein
MTTDAQGCQTNNELTLSVNPNLSSTVNQSICQGSSFTFNGQNYSSAGSFPVTLTSQTGCDSVVTLNLTVNPAPVTQLSESICAGGSFTFGSQNLTQSGQYSQTLQTTSGCDSIVNLNLVVNPVITATQNTTICQGQTVNFFGQTLTNTGLYSQSLQTVNGCDSIVNLNLLVNPLPSTPNAQFEWSGPQNFSSQNASVSFEVNVEDMGDYSVFAILNGCSSSPAITSVSIINLYDFDDYDFPNVITPNGDGINDSLDINGYYKTCQEYNLLIYNRWGHVVYEQNISTIPFSGKSSGDIELLDGIYFYKLSFGDKTKSGFLHIIR